MSPAIHAYTSITTNYLPKARVLGQSIQKHHPDVKFHLVLSDDLPEGFDLANEPFESVILAESLPIEDPDKFFFVHSVVELCTAVKGMALEHIFEQHNADIVFYFDPDMAIFSPLDRLVNELQDNSILLTPHQTEPEQTDQAIVDNELCSLRYGVFNLGFVGVKNDADGRRFSGWWRDRLLKYCQDNIPRGLFTDQKWVNLAPCYFDNLKVLRAPVYNVATWNLTHRYATGSSIEDVHINGEPLCFYHFSGFDSGGQEYMLNKYGKHSPILFDLREWYIQECDKNGQETLGKVPCKYGFYADGTKIANHERVIYRDQLELHERFANPFSSDENSFQKWLAEGAAEQVVPADKVAISPTAGVRDVVQSMANYFYTVSYTERANSCVKRFLLRNFARALRVTGNVVFK